MLAGCGDRPQTAAEAEQTVESLQRMQLMWEHARRGELASREHDIAAMMAAGGSQESAEKRWQMDYDYIVSEIERLKRAIAQVRAAQQAQEPGRAGGSPP